MGVSSSQPVPEPPQSTAISQTSPAAERVPHYRPKMDDIAASQQLLEEQARYTPNPKRVKRQQPKRVKKTPGVKSFSFDELQAYVNDISPQNDSFSPPHQVEVPDSQIELSVTNSHDPPESPFVRSGIAIPASVPKSSTRKKDSKISNTEVPSSVSPHQSMPSDTENAETLALATLQSKRKYKRGKYYTKPALDEAESEQASVRFEQNTTVVSQPRDVNVETEEGVARNIKSSSAKKKYLARKSRVFVPVDNDNLAIEDDAVCIASQPALQKKQRCKRIQPGHSKAQPASTSVDIEDLLPLVNNVEEPPANALPDESSSGEDEIPHISPPKTTGCGTKPSKQRGYKAKKPSKPQRRYSRKSTLDLSITAADRALNTVRDVHHPPDLRSGGAYTEDEDELIRRAIRDYQERKGLETEELVDVIQWSNVRVPNPNLKDVQAEEESKESKEFWDELREVCPRRQMPAFKAHVRSQYHVFKSGQWTEEEDGDLKRLVQMYPGRWKLISQAMGNRSLLDVYNRWKDYVQYGEQRNTSRWSSGEEELLKRALRTITQRDEDHRAETGQPSVAIYTNAHINWPEVCKEMGNIRSRLQCTVKWSAMKKRDPFLEVRPVYGRGRTPDPDQVVGPTPRKGASRKNVVGRDSVDDEDVVVPTPRNRGRPQTSKNPSTPIDGTAKKMRKRPMRQLDKSGKLPKICDHFKTLEEATDTELEENQDGNDRISATPPPSEAISSGLYTPGISQMQGGDKFDLVVEVAQLEPDSEESIDWDTVSNKLKDAWAPDVLQEAFQELLKLVEDQGSFIDTVIQLANNITDIYRDELDQRYVPQHNQEVVNGDKAEKQEASTEANQPNTKRKRKLGKRDSLPGTRLKRMKRGSDTTTQKKFKSTDRITASDDSEGEGLGADDAGYAGYAGSE